jgi:hypothetical protein
MTTARWSIVTVLIALTLLTGINLATAQVAVKAEDRIGTWELVSTKNLNTGEAVSGVNDAKTGLQWMQFTRSHFMVVGMTRDRSVTSPADFAKLSPEEKVKTNYARIWNEKNEQIFVARGGTYSIEGDKIHQKSTMALNTFIIGVDSVLKVTRLDKSTLIAQVEFPPVPDPTTPTHTRELTFRRLE